jgi:hypothetical protein
MNSTTTTIFGQIGGALLTSLGAALAQADYSALGAYKTVAQAGALLFSELAQALNAKWNPPPATTTTQTTTTTGQAAG